MMEEYVIELFEQQRTRSRRKSGTHSYRQSEGSDFCCRRCQAYVTIEPLFSGVRNRNHCPYCLWSRHLDLKYSGDRLAACKGLMQPVGLTVKRTWDKYGLEKLGELMLIHRCVDCDRLSINRIAADDDPLMVLQIFSDSFTMDAAFRESLWHSGIRPLQEDEASLIRVRLFGYQSSLSGCVV